MCVYFWWICMQVHVCFVLYQCYTNKSYQTHILMQNSATCKTNFMWCIISIKLLHGWLLHDKPKGFLVHLQSIVNSLGGSLVKSGYIFPADYAICLTRSSLISGGSPSLPRVFPPVLATIRLSFCISCFSFVFNSSFLLQVTHPKLD